MPAPWVFLRVNPETTLALPVDEIHRVLHRNDPEFEAFAPLAGSLAETLGVVPDPRLPGVLVVLCCGDSWFAGDSSLEELPSTAAYCSFAPEFFHASKPWCRGVLFAGERLAFVTDSDLLGRAGSVP